MDENPSPQDAIGKLAASLKGTVDAGKVDFGLQYVPLSGGKYVLVGAFHVVGTETFASGLQDVLQEVSDRPGLESLQLNAAEHQGIAFHKLVGTRTSPQDRQLYGGRPALLVGAGERMLWFAVGGDQAERVLKESIDLIIDTRDETLENAAALAPIQASIHLTPWLQLDPGPAVDESAADGTAGGDGAAEEDAAARRTPGFRLEAARQAFNETNDRVQLEVQPSETGLRVRLRLDEGALRFIGMMMARRIDRTQL